MVVAGIVAGGIGARMGQYSVPKQFLPIAGKPVIVHTAEKFLSSPDIDYVVIGVHKNWVQFSLDLKNKYFKGESRLIITSGGNDRNQTILEIIKISQKIFKLVDDDIIVTHDAVRPFLSLQIIHDNVVCASKYGVCDTVIAATDTIISSSNNEYITDIPVRNEMYQGQTPQSFKVGLFNEVYNNSSSDELKAVTDACKLFYLRGYHVKLVKGESSNLKITYPYDYKMAQIMMGDYDGD